MKPLRCTYVNKFYKVLNVNNDSLTVMCVVLADYMAKGGLAAIDDYIRLWN